MTERERDPSADPQGSDVQGTAEDGASFDASVEELENARDEALRERNELLERLQRLTAEFQNFRRRSESQIEDQVRLRLEGLLGSLITVLDAMDAAYRSTFSKRGQDPSAQAFLDGFEHIRSLLSSALEGAGLQKIESVGKPYDPRQHEALITVPSASHPPNTVLEELRSGYRMRDRVVRPAQVSVSGAAVTSSGQGGTSAPS